MRFLIVDTTSSNLIVSIIDDKKIKYFYSGLVKSDMSTLVLPLIDKGLKESNLLVDDIDKIIVSVGPGSFTGIRIGVTISKIIAWSLNKAVIPISSLELMATTDVDTKYVVPIIDARRGNVFAGIYDRDLNNVEKDSLISFNDLKEKLNDNYTIVSRDNFDDSKKVDVDLLKIVEKYYNSKGINPHNLNPNYLKLTEAEENRLKND